jgi:hypothetical protein
MDVVEMKITARTLNGETISLDGFQMLAARNERYSVSIQATTRLTVWALS